MEKLNDKKNLIGFENGIYNLETSEFREGLPEDFVICRVVWYYLLQKKISQ